MTPHRGPHVVLIERQVGEGQSLMTEHDPADLMSVAAERIHAFNHQSRPAQLADAGVPAPDVYRITGSAAELAHGMPQALTQLADALQRSSPVLRVYYPAGHPAENIAIALGALLEAAEAFSAAAQHLSFAQAAIAYQGVTESGRRPCV